MQETSASIVDSLMQRLESDHADLVEAYQRTLRERIFTNRAEMRPVMLGKLAADEADIFLNYLRDSKNDNVLQRGAKLCELGLSEQSVLGLGETCRQFFLSHLHNEAIIPALQAIDAYNHAVIQGFMANREKVILNEQERIRSALQRTLEPLLHCKWKWLPVWPGPPPPSSI